MKIAPMGEVRNNFAKYLAAAEEELVFVTRNGKIAAVIEHINDHDIISSRGAQASARCWTRPSGSRAPCLWRGTASSAESNPVHPPERHGSGARPPG